MKATVIANTITVSYCMKSAVTDMYSHPLTTCIIFLGTGIQDLDNESKSMANAIMKALNAGGGMSEVTPPSSSCCYRTIDILFPYYFQL